MSTTSKSPRKVALVALEVGRHALPAYSHRCSPKVYTQPQLFACLVLKEFFRTDYRGIAALLADAGYDAEWVHCVAREDLGVRTIIPAKIGGRLPSRPRATIGG